MGQITRKKCFPHKEDTHLSILSFPVSNRFIHDDKAGFVDHLNYAFVYGMIFDVCIWRGRMIGIAGLPDYAAHVQYLTTIKAQYHDYFHHGRFETLSCESLPAGIRAAKFVRANGDFIVTFWNTTEKETTVEVFGKSTTVAAKDVAVIEYLI